MAALRTFYQRIIDFADSQILSSGRLLAGPGGSRRNTFLRRLLGASTATFGLICAGAPVAYAQFTCTWNDATANWTTAADWSSCNGTFPNNGGGNTYSATISTGDPTLTTAITIGNITVNTPGVWSLTGSGANATLTGSLSNTGSISVDGFTVGGSGGSSLSVGEALTNNAGASFGIGNNVITTSSTVQAASLSNAGTLERG